MSLNIYCGSRYKECGDVAGKVKVLYRVSRKDLDKLGCDVCYQVTDTKKGDEGANKEDVKGAWSASDGLVDLWIWDKGSCMVCVEYSFKIYSQRYLSIP